MTILQPDRLNALWNRVLVGLGLALLLSAVYLVWLYTRVVNLEHNLAQARADLQSAQTANSELKDKTFSLFGDSQIRSFAAEHDLVPDRSPRYLTVNIPNSRSSGR